MRYVSIVGLAFLILACGTMDPEDQPDLVVELHLDSNSTSEAGEVVKLSATVRNEGDAPSDSTTLRYYQSSDSIFSKDDKQIGTAHIDSLFPEEPEFLSSVTVGNQDVVLSKPAIPHGLQTAPVLTGLIACYFASVDTVSGESNIENNLSSGAKVTTVHPGFGVEDGVGVGYDIEKKKALAEVLFGSKPANYDYNNYGNCPPGFNCDLEKPSDCGKPCRWYRCGHSGWDVQTQSVAGDTNTANEPFYSLTPGEVIGTGGKYGMIAVYYEGKTILYLHARKIDVTKDSIIDVRTRLGIQGNVGLGFSDSDSSKSEHVHIEVRKGRTTSAAIGAYNASGELDSTIIDPVEFLYSVLKEKGAVD